MDSPESAWEWRGEAAGGGSGGLSPLSHKAVRACCVTQSCLILPTQWVVDCRLPLSMGLYRHKSWSGLPFPSLRDLGNFSGLQQGGNKAGKREGKEMLPPGTHFDLILYPCYDKMWLFCRYRLFGGIYPQLP